MKKEEAKNKTIAVTLENYKKLSILYRNAVRDGISQVKFEDADLLVSYLKYMLEYMETASGTIASYLAHKKEKK